MIIYFHKIILLTVVDCDASLERVLDGVVAVGVADALRHVLGLAGVADAVPEVAAVVALGRVRRRRRRSRGRGCCGVGRLWGALTNDLSTQGEGDYPISHQKKEGYKERGVTTPNI